MRRSICQRTVTLGVDVSSLYVFDGILPITLQAELVFSQKSLHPVSRCIALTTSSVLCGHFCSMETAVTGGVGV